MLINLLPKNKSLGFILEASFKLINHLISIFSLSIEYKDPNVFKKKVDALFNEILFTNLFLTTVSSVGINFSILPLFLSI